MIKVLILDDDKDLGELLQDYLKGFGFEVVVCHHPKEAFAIIESEKPDLMTLDVMMPEQDGFSFFKRTKAKKPPACDYAHSKRRSDRQSRWPRNWRR